MQSVSEVKFRSQSLGDSNMDWNYEGQGKVDVTLASQAVSLWVYFAEKIAVSAPNGATLNLEDKKRWQFYEDSVEFWHCRGGEYVKILSFSVDESGEHFVLGQDYYCDPDTYSGSLAIVGDEVHFSVNVESRADSERSHIKRESMNYIYS